MGKEEKQNVNQLLHPISHSLQLSVMLCFMEEKNRHIMKDIEISRKLLPEKTV